MIRTLAIVSSILALASAECPNGCSSHGRCTAYDMCLCYRNWMANDCSERVCQFGLAHVDTPKGDLDASSGPPDGTDEIVAQNSEVYPFGTTEQFPAMMAGGMYQENTAHYYMECSNKGICDREFGTCECFPGYEGSSCQRASCPSNADGTCSGHGTCETIKQIAARDSGNIYELWDEKSTMGCVCDAGYYGADCALRECKYGADPLYFDDNANIRYSNWTVVIAVKGRSPAHPVHGSGADVKGEYSIMFYDHFGEDWETTPLQSTANCADIVKALEDIPNDVIPDGSVRCLQHLVDDQRFDFWNHLVVNDTMFISKVFTLAFPENPGYLKEIRLNKYLDGARPTLYADEEDADLTLFTFANGFHGEDDDMVPDECEDVIIYFGREDSPTNPPGGLKSGGGFGEGVSAPSLADLDHYYYLKFTDPAVMEPLLKRCLADANNDESYARTEDEVYNWDYGTQQNPHLVKFIEDDRVMSRVCSSLTTDFALVDEDHGAGFCWDDAPQGFYAPVIYYEGTDAEDEFGRFIVYSNAPDDYNERDRTNFRVFTTTGYLNRVRFDAEVFTHYGDFRKGEHLNDWTQLHSNVLYTYNRGATENRRIFNDTDLLAYNGIEGFTNQSDWSGYVDCETDNGLPVDGDVTKMDCLQKGDRVMFFSTENTAMNYALNPRYHNMYTVEKIFHAYPEHPTTDTLWGDNEEPYRNRIVLDMHVNFYAPLSKSETPLKIGGLAGTSAANSYLEDSRLRAYKFYPPAVTVNYVDQCSGRGICNTDSGLCECFAGYTKDDCSVQNTAAK